MVGLMVAAGCVAGCGGGGSKASSKVHPTNRYIDEVNAAQRDFAASVRPISSAVTPTSSSRSDRAALRRLGLAVQALETRLKAIVPPAQVASLQGTLLAELAAYDREIQRTVRRLASRRSGPVLRARRSLVRITHTAGARIDATLTAINARLH
jgi:hypothetical protein